MRQQQELLTQLALRLTPPGGLWAVKEALGRLVDHPELLAELHSLAERAEAPRPTK